MKPRVLVVMPQAGRDAPIGEPVMLDARQRHYLSRVLRLEAGAQIEAFNGTGQRWAARLAGTRETLHLVLDAPLAATPESPLAIHLGQCLSSADKMDWTIEKAVELGANRISPLFSQRSQVRIDEARARRKLEHWQAIAESACMQSGRDVIASISAAGPLEAWLTACTEPVRLVLDPRAGLALSAWARQSATPFSGPMALLVGPESGLAESELELSRRAGFIAVTLGPRVLRTETAGLAAIAALQALAGDF